MENAHLPIYLIVDSCGGWFCIEVGPDLSGALTFGCPEDAKKYAEHMAKKKGVPLSSLWILRFDTTGEVFSADGSTKAMA